MRGDASPSVSIALATCDGARFLPAQLDSLARQTAPPLELVVSDDASSDDSLGIVEQFSRTAPFPVRLIRQTERLGYRRNFLRAAAACAGDLVAFCDQDDVWRREKLEAIRAPFADPRVLLAFHEAGLVDAGGRTLSLGGAPGAARIFEPLAFDPFTIVRGFSQVFRRSLLRFAALQGQSLDPYHPAEPLAHDQFMIFWAGALGRIAYRPERLVDYRRHDGALFGRPHPLVEALHHLANRRRFQRGRAAAAANRVRLLERAVDEGLIGAAEAAPAIGYYSGLSARNGGGGAADQR